LKNHLSNYLDGNLNKILDERINYELSKINKIFFEKTKEITRKFERVIPEIFENKKRNIYNSINHITQNSLNDVEICFNNIADEFETILIGYNNNIIEKNKKILLENSILKETIVNLEKYNNELLIKIENNIEEKSIRHVIDKINENEILTQMNIEKTQEIISDLDRRMNYVGESNDKFGDFFKKQIKDLNTRMNKINENIEDLKCLKVEKTNISEKKM